jgi:uncharacterized membrane protein
MEAALTEFLSLCLRWLHMIAGMAWIGSSFYFIHLDLTLKPNPGIPPKAQGEAWEVHGGGFYQMVKYLVAPDRMPDQLAWFKWEAYTTWLSGFGLLIVTFYLNAELFLVDPMVLDLPATWAIAISVACLIAGWFIYDATCRSPLGRHENTLAAFEFVLLVAVFYGFCNLFSARGAFIEMGALIGTMMVGNVFAVIIPNQKKMVAALIAGQTPEPALGLEGKQRSVHNNYLTLPVVFLMISNHYPLIFGTKYNWLIFAIVLLIGFLIRYFYSFRHAGKPNPWWTWGVVVALMLVIGWLSWIGSRNYEDQAASSSAPVPSVPFSAVQEIVIARCSVCHSPEPVWSGFAAAPKGVFLDTPESIKAHARQIQIFAVLTTAMPPGNITELSEADRDRLGIGLAQFAAAK